MKYLAAFVVCVGVVGCLMPSATAQDTDEMLIGGVPLENAAVGRDLALRLRAEVQLTEDSDDLIDTDVNYARFPTRMYSGEAKVFQSNRATYSGSYSLWENRQDLEIQAWAWKMRVPLEVEPQMIYDTYDTGAGSFLTLQYRNQTSVADTNSTISYYSAAVDRYFQNGVYAYLQYRHSMQDGHAGGHQLSEYVNWKISNRVKVGEHAAVSQGEGATDFAPWYVRFFWTFFLVEDWTSLRCETRFYTASADLHYQEYKTYLYQKIGSRSLVRLSYRYYADNEGLNSKAWGIKLKHYFSPRFSAHVGYRYYDHSQGTDFDTAYAGLGLLL